MIVFQRGRTFFVFLSIFITLITIASVIFIIKGGRNVDIVGDVSNGSGQMSMLRGEECERGSTRPYAVMLAEDSIARPLSGIAFADIVIEMPVLTDGINRMMAIYQCKSPSEIGSVRSARHDFIPLASGFDAIFAHWGGSHYALDDLNGGIIDNIDALPNPFSAFWRKSNILAPHNGFTSLDKLVFSAESLGYRTDSHTFVGYSRKDKDSSSEGGVLRIEYPSRVSYKYIPETGVYARYRGNLQERDALTHKQVEADVVIVIYAASRQLEPDYNDVDIEGEGDLAVFQEGREQKGTWRKQKDSINSPLEFFDDNGDDMVLVKGTLWIQVVSPSTGVTYTLDT